MIEALPESEGNVIGVKASGTLTDADYKDVWMPRLLDAIQAHGKVRCLLYMDDTFEGWEFGAAKDDASFFFHHGGEIERCALVGGPKWVTWSARLFSHLMKAEVRLFAEDELAQAWEWLRET